MVAVDVVLGAEHALRLSDRYGDCDPITASGKAGDGFRRNAMELEPGINGFDGFGMRRDEGFSLGYAEMLTISRGWKMNDAASN